MNVWLHYSCFWFFIVADTTRTLHQGHNGQFLEDFCLFVCLFYIYIFFDWFSWHFECVNDQLLWQLFGVYLLFGKYFLPLKKERGKRTKLTFMIFCMENSPVFEITTNRLNNSAGLIVCSGAICPEGISPRIFTLYKWKWRFWKLFAYIRYNRVINPRLTKLFFVTRLTKGGCYNHLSRFSEQNPLWNWFWYQ